MFWFWTGLSIVGFAAYELYFKPAPVPVPPPGTPPLPVLPNAVSSPFAVGDTVVATALGTPPLSILMTVTALTLPADPSGALIQAVGINTPSQPTRSAIGPIPVLRSAVHKASLAEIAALNV
jgi:hypothetical protein